ncbi:hypothetical protein [Burkholderia seminalis]|uniref:Uncharacterized protein n=1 Tax=Burkholderia seminalis TaxID=488731 RepID=A0A8A8CZQ4_9BURK|nr:hypothetical protein [Burkholderia seminalis]QTO17921.1 hypothetical protein DT99_012580 [Burkholderia seminalis]
MSDVNVMRVELNPDGVARPGLMAARDGSEIVRFAFHAMEQIDLSVPPPVAGEAISYDMGSGPASAEERRRFYENWILSKAFTELARGIRETLEEAYLFTRIVGLLQRPTTLTDFRAEESRARVWAQGAMFPALIAAVSAALTEPLTFSSEFESLQKVRNCLEHRAGIVGARDIGRNGSLVLNLPRLKIFYYRGTEEIELESGARIEPGDDREHVQICARRVTREREYVLGERVTFSVRDFHEIAFSCHLFVHDLVGKLPHPELH